MQLTHAHTKFQRKTFPIILVCDNVNNAPNIGSLFRAADAFGVDRIIFCGENISLGKRMKRTSRSTEKYVKYSLETNITTVLAKFKLENHTLVALEITANSQQLKEFQIDRNRPIVLIIGNENFGVSEEALKLADQTIHINMYGENSSMNVIQATSIVLYEVTNLYLN